MAGITLEKGRIIYNVGQPLTALHLITGGRVCVTYPGGFFYLTKGDVIGICEICSDVHFLSYTVEEEVGIVTYPCPNLSVLDDIISKHTDVARFFLLSAFRQIVTILEHSSISMLNCGSIFQTLNDDYEKYKDICNKNKINFLELADYSSISNYLGEEQPDFWLSGYYQGLAHIYSSNNYQFMVTEPSLSIGLLRKCSLDFRKVFFSTEEQNTYIHQINSFYFNETESDLFALYTGLYYKLGNENEYSKELLSSIKQFELLYGKEDICDVDQALLDRRISAFEDNIALIINENTETEAELNENDENISELTNSLKKLLDFSDTDMEFDMRFAGNIAKYKNLVDKFSADSDSCDLRSELTDDFYELYTRIFLKCQTIEEIPVIVKMFLYFGYVDETLAGASNAAYLRDLAESLREDYDNNVYTLFGWLTLIYKGKKEPSRNEFDQDYSGFIHKQKLSGAITDTQARILEHDTTAKVKYELVNMFPTVNKVSYGRVSVFCPIFIKENIFKELEHTLVTSDKIMASLESIKKIDYTAFYREYLSMDYIDTIGRESMHYEYLPNFILMPNIGIRGIMWQEIEGKKRISPSRMCISIFHLEDFDMTMLRLVAEFRWELCKRIQGSRWNDVGDRSLTSEYFDYAQFYKKNRELTSEAKEKIRINLQRAKNSFKEMFIKDYIVWILFESNNSPRMNKIVRKIFFTYCPFSADKIEVISKNPMYTELLSRYKLTQAQKLHHLNMLIQKLGNGRKAVPDILRQEIKFTEGTSVE